MALPGITRLAGGAGPKPQAGTAPLSPAYEKKEPAGKPGSVEGNHSSGTAVTDGL